VDYPVGKAHALVPDGLEHSMDQASYGQFCPVAMAAEIVCTRWTALVLRELLCGGRRFNDLRKGVPRMSPTLLSKRLKELEDAKIIRHVKDARTGASEYVLTEAGEDLRPIIMAMGNWGQRWIDSNLSLRNLDPSLLMWDMRRNINPAPLPKRRVTVRFTFPEAAASQRDWWLVVEPDGGNDLCQVDPGHDIDLFVSATLRALTAVWMGHSSLAEAEEKRLVEIVGDTGLARTMQAWLGLSVFARQGPAGRAA
jgi:DNA-binding HxlR family transcriptional regulator